MNGLKIKGFNEFERIFGGDTIVGRKNTICISSVENYKSEQDEIIEQFSNDKNENILYKKVSDDYFWFAIPFSMPLVVAILGSKLRKKGHANNI